MSRPSLPERRNPMLEEDRAPGHEILVERRCLGQTELKVKPGQVGTSNATKQENLGTLDYAHLRVPLPKDLSGSGIFAKGANRKWPEAYFLMRRSSDGFISATGMFKAAFPYAQVEEETTEKDYIKSLDEASSEEVAGNVWIDPGRALDLSKEYGIELWIAALLDPEPITHGTSDPKKGIKSPPPYDMKTGIANGVGRTPQKTPAKGGRAAARSTRGASALRSVSPTLEKPKPTGRKMASPKKSTRGRKAKLDAVGENETQDDGASVNGDGADTVKVEVETTRIPDENGEEFIEDTKVRVTAPANHPDLPPPQDTETMLKQAREMVESAKELEGVKTRNSKSKAEELIEENEEIIEALERPAKRARPLEIELRKERIRRRALTGIAASLAIGALIPTLMTAFGA
ncbi:hypothetical protein DOTSEDRAFT_177566 [Dothistroma septosporum NZE10]|uniref:HTH APSES-type domain-containing protein n=1 Tax=Dothistroma septosporum (strain NZE10 / CBS 128990) TaxID=675120 RepID=N1PGR5_DOTSN|nr:hypothetical protein DOTSEDRAFT_177566 [Dothistroma septosporum NZE10]